MQLIEAKFVVNVLVRIKLCELAASHIIRTKCFFKKGQHHQSVDTHMLWLYFVYLWTTLGHTKLIICFWFPAWSIFLLSGCAITSQNVINLIQIPSMYAL